jgi:hypothetical protein
MIHDFGGSSGTMVLDFVLLRFFHLVWAFPLRTEFAEEMG